MFIRGSCALPYRNPMRAWFFSAILLGLFVLGLFVLGAGMLSAQAQPYGPPERDGVQPLDRLLPGIRRAHPGDFYDAEGPTYGPSGDPHYHLKWVTPDGRVIWYDADARNGRVLRSSPGRDSFDDHSPFGGGRFGGPPPGYGRPFGPGEYGGAPYSGERFTPRFAPRGYGGGGWHGGGGGRWRR
jgi:hypothetical protein